MIDYGGKMPELQQRLCALLKLIQKVHDLLLACMLYWIINYAAQCLYIVNIVWAVHKISFSVLSVRGIRLKPIKIITTLNTKSHIATTKVGSYKGFDLVK